MNNNILIQLFKELERCDSHYVVLRNYHSLPLSTDGSDIDMFVPSEEIDNIKNLMIKQTKLIDCHLVSYTEDTYSPKICMLNTRSGAQIDLFLDGLYCKGHKYILGSEILSNTIIHNGVRVLEPRYGDLISMLKEILNNGICKEKYITTILKNKHTYTQSYLRNHLTLFSNEFVMALKSAISDDKIRERASNLQKIGLQYLEKNGSKTCYKISKLKRLFLQPGYTIAVLGTDGSGKSYIIKSLTPIINEAFHNGIYYEHMRPNYLPSLAVISGKKKLDTNDVCTNPHASKPSGFIGSIVRLSYYWIDYTFGYFRKVFIDKAIKTHVWIFDRYFYDYYLDQRRARINLPNWIIKLYGLFVPSPDLTLCLGGDPEKIYTRKPETSLEEVKRQTETLHMFCESHKNTVWIDTTVNPEESVNTAMEAIVKMMSQRFKNIKLG